MQFTETGVILTASHGYHSRGRLLLYPDPAREAVTVDCPGQQFDFTLTDMMGHLPGEWKNNVSKKQIDISDIPPGVYFVHCGAEV